MDIDSFAMLRLAMRIDANSEQESRILADSPPPRAAHLARRYDDAREREIPLKNYMQQNYLPYGLSLALGLGFRIAIAALAAAASGSTVDETGVEDCEGCG